jgi:hypothetical protein
METMAPTIIIIVPVGQTKVVGLLKNVDYRKYSLKRKMSFTRESFHLADCLHLLVT